MIMFYECGYPMRIAYMVFLIITILTLMFLLWLLIKWKRERKQIVLCSLGLVASFVIYTILLGDHITPLEALVWQGHNFPLPIAVLWIVMLAVFAVTGLSIVKISRQHKNTVTEENIKEALDEVPLAICCFQADGIPMLCNRRMQEISEMLCGRIFMRYSELKAMLTQRKEWREPGGDIFRLPDGTVCRYAEEELVTADGEHYLVSNFFDVTELAQRKTELEAQNEELRKLSATLLRLRENVRLLAKEEEILSIKARWHDVMGEGLTAIRRALLSNQTQEATNMALKRWSDAVIAIQRSNDAPDRRRDAVGDLLRDARGLQIQLVIEGQMPADKATQQVFVLAMRNCLLNAAQHAKATELYANIVQTEKANILSVKNNGIQPESEIILRGGLINVKNHAECIGGSTEIQSTPYFELEVSVPGKE